MKTYRHGTVNRYENGCRCPLCVWAYRKYQRDAYPCNKLTIKVPKKPTKGKDNA